MICPRCGSQKTIKSGIRVASGGKRQQRMKCRECGHHFLDEDEVI